MLLKPATAIPGIEFGSVTKIIRIKGLETVGRDLLGTFSVALIGFEGDGELDRTSLWAPAFLLKGLGCGVPVASQIRRRAVGHLLKKHKKRRQLDGR